MSKAEIISQSIVLLDLLKGEIIGQNTIKSPFTELSNFLFLKQIINKNGIQGRNDPVMQEYVFGNFFLQHQSIPPKFSIIDNEFNKKDNKDIKNIAFQLIKIGNLESKIGAIGINYELIIDNSTESVKLKETICKTNIANAFEGMSITFRHEINESIRLNLTVSDGKNTDDKKIIVISANFHNDINPSNKIEDIFKTDFFKILKEKEKILFEI